MENRIEALKALTLQVGAHQPDAASFAAAASAAVDAAAIRDSGLRLLDRLIRVSP